MSLAFLFLSSLLLAAIHLLRPPVILRVFFCILNAAFVIGGSLFLLGTPGGTLMVGNWPHLAGISWMLDETSFVFILGCSLIYLPIALSLVRQSHYTQSLFHFLFASLIGAFLTADLFNLFVMFEILLISTYALFYRAGCLRDGFAFIWVNIFGSCLFLFGIAYLYFSFGTVNMADLSLRFHEVPAWQQNWIFWSFSVVFLIKAGIAPFFFWLPRAYPSLDYRILAFVAATLSKVGVFSFMRFSGVIATEAFERGQSLLISLSFVSVLLGFILSMGEKSLKARICYFGMSHIGFLFLLISASGTQAVEGFHFYLLQDILIFALGFFLLFRVSDPHEISKGTLRPLIFFVLLFSSAGFPIGPAFWAKLQLLQSLSGNPLAFLMILVSSFVFIFWAASTWIQFGLSKEKADQNLILRFSWRRLSAAFVVLSFLLLSFSDQKLFREADASVKNKELFVKRQIDKSFQSLQDRNQELDKAEEIHP